jgi:hypothetical protein
MDPSDGHDPPDFVGLARRSSLPGHPAGASAALWDYRLEEAEGCPLLVLTPVPIIATSSYPFLHFSGTVRADSDYPPIGLLKWRQDGSVIQTF